MSAEDAPASNAADAAASSAPSVSTIPVTNDDEYDYLFKVVLIGDSGVGKVTYTHWHHEGIG